MRGHAPGGGTERSLCCDFVICATDAKFRLAEINIGVIPGAGAGVRLTRWMGRLKAKEILMLGDVISGEDAVLFGSGLAAVASSMFSLLKTGDHVILQKSLYVIFLDVN